MLSNNIFWMWLWFLCGAMVYIGKRAFYMITGPSPVATGVISYIKVAGIPIAFRLFAESIFYWMLFNPAIAQSALSYFGWEQAASGIAVITKYAPVSALLGLSIDSMADWAIPTIIGKIPFLKDWWPQMPGPNSK